MESVQLKPLKSPSKMGDFASCLREPLELRVRRPRVILIDDDPIFLAIMKRSAQLEGIELDGFLGLDDLGYIGLFAHYDVAILDFDLGIVNAIEVSQSISSLVKELPILIVSARDRSKDCMNCPKSVKSILRKSMGYQYILRVALRFCLESKSSLA
ncbi:MAG: response regulator [Proteobacteria bacterium]|nr:response regulator [Pseudomonadota bacterium]